MGCWMENDMSVKEKHTSVSPITYYLEKYEIPY